MEMDGQLSLANMTLQDPVQITPIEFAKEIDDLVRRHKFNHVNAVTYWAEKHEVNIEDLPQLINKPLKEKLKIDYENLNYLPKNARLPL